MIASENRKDGSNRTLEIFTWIGYSVPLLTIRNRNCVFSMFPGNKQGSLWVLSSVSAMSTGNNPQTFTQLVEETYPLLYRFAYRLSGSAADAEDLTQQTFLAAQSNFDQLRNSERARSWLFTIARNTFLKEKRQNKLSMVSLELAGEPTNRTVEFPLLDSEELQELLTRLPEEFRVMIVLYYFREFSYKRISEIMELPIGTVMSRLARAKEHLRQMIFSRETAPTDS